MQNHVLFFLLNKTKKSKILWIKKSFLDIMPFSSWAGLATWLHLGAPQKLQEK
jgi:hypothetical protein